MQFVCRCGACSIYLKRKGNTDMVGAYCMDCGKWVKWVGKKDLNNLLKQGFIVHNESYESPTVKLKQEQIARDKELLEKVTNVPNSNETTEVSKVENMELNLCCKNCGKLDLGTSYVRKISGTHTGVYCSHCSSWVKWLSKKEIAYLESIGVDLNSLEPENKKPKAQIHDENEYEDVDSEFNEDFFAEYDESEDNEYIDAEDKSTKVVNCDFCNGKSSLDPIIESKVNLTYFAGVLSIIDENETELLGSYKMSYCPRCGRDLDKK